MPRASPVLYLDATADPIITEAYLPALEHQQIDVKQRAVVSQVVDPQPIDLGYERIEYHRMTAAEYVSDRAG